MQIVEKVSATLGLPDSIEVTVPVAENHSNICKFDTQDDTFELVIDNISDLVHHSIRRASSLSVPAITIQTPQTTRRRLSVSSFHSDDSFSDGSAESSRLDLRIGMPSSSSLDLTSMRSRDSSMLVSLEVLPVVFIPYSENPDFVGREGVFESLRSILQATIPGQKRVALHGLGGVG